MFFRLVFIALPFCVWLAMWPLFATKVAKNRMWRLTVWMALGACYAKFAGYRIFGGSTFLPVLPAGIIWCWSFAYSFAMLLAAAMFAIAAFRCILGIVRVKFDTNRAGATTVALGSLAVAAYGLNEGCRVPRVKAREIALDGLPPAFDGYKIIHLTDLHISPAARKERTEGIVNVVNSLNADLICITGDLIDGHVDEREEDVLPLSNLSAKDGVLACTGNHEFYSNYEEWQPVFRRCGIEMLENAHRTIVRGDSAIVVGGIMDKQGTNIPRGDGRFWEGPDAHLAFAASDPKACRILLAHRPLQLAQHAAEGVKLQLSGHTHGGAIPGLDLLVARANEGHVRGFYREHGLTLFVHPGTGQWAGFPMRLGVPAEITCLILRSV